LRVALVTGAGRGVGKVVAGALASEGFAVAAVARTQAEVEATAAALPRAIAVAADVTRESDVARTVGRVQEKLGPIDLLVNNAGRARGIGPVWEVAPGEWWGDVEACLRSAFLCTRAVAPTMRRQRRGKVVNVSSMTVPTAPPGFAHYVASKAAIVGLTRALARELGPDGICVNTLTPDYIAFDREYDNRQPAMAPTLAAQRVFAREEMPEDLVGTLLYLIGPGSDFVTGQNIWVNGGRAFN
jgi:3-oxoacyl-[acyl-carrier protein] reductase